MCQDGMGHSGAQAVLDRPSPRAIRGSERSTPAAAIGGLSDYAMPRLEVADKSPLPLASSTQSPVLQGDSNFEAKNDSSIGHKPPPADMPTPTQARSSLPSDPPHGELTRAQRKRLAREEKRQQQTPSEPSGGAIAKSKSDHSAKPTPAQAVAKTDVPAREPTREKSVGADRHASGERADLANLPPMRPEKPYIPPGKTTTVSQQGTSSGAPSTTGPTGASEKPPTAPAKPVVAMTRAESMIGRVLPGKIKSVSTKQAPPRSAPTGESIAPEYIGTAKSAITMVLTQAIFEESRGKFDSRSETAALRRLHQLAWNCPLPEKLLSFAERAELKLKLLRGIEMHFGDEFKKLTLPRFLGIKPS